MKISLLISFAFMLLFSSVVSAQKQFTGTYKMIVQEQTAGEEKFTINVKADGGIQSEASMTYGIPNNKIITTATKDKPVSLIIESGGTKVSVTTFDANGAKVVNTGQAEKDVKTQASVIVENGVWHHFYYLLMQYDMAKSGKQNFRAFLATQAFEYNIEVERVESPTLNVKGKPVTVDKFRLVTVQNLTLELWADKDRLPLLITIPSQGVKVIRNDAEDLAAVVFPKPAQTEKTNENANFSSEEVSFQNGNVKLAGTLTIPKSSTSPQPAAILITGSGGQDRDGSGAVFNLYKIIAETLSSSGVAVLRVDDRGVGKSVIPQGEQTSYKDFINDSRAAFDYLLTRTKDIDPKRIAYIGHSEGSETALTIAADDKRVAAIVLLAGTSTPVGDVAREQSIYQLALQETIDPSDETKFPEIARFIIKMFDDAKTQKATETKDKLSWFREHNASNPSALAMRVSCPVLIMNGERDALVLAYHSIQLSQALAKGGNKNVRLRIFPNLTHLFTPTTMDSTVTVEKATEINKDFLRALQEWMKQTFAIK